ncbi:MAG: DJ-1/PfpI family protein [Candidatus Omnitrophica bacterium]|nr:DJ-1/PfpI family protein [Candidatus Omnitrophota bacterium]
MSKKVLILLAEGFEEIEAVTIIDVLRRAEFNVTVAAVSGVNVTGAHGLKVEADIELAAYQESPDAIVLPGGMPGSQHLGDSPLVAGWIQKMHNQKKLVGAICAAPALALARHGILNGKQATCYPGFERHFQPGVKHSAARVVVDGNVITSQGPGSALEFSLALVKQLGKPEKAQELQEGMLVSLSSRA